MLRISTKLRLATFRFGAMEGGNVPHVEMYEVKGTIYMLILRVSIWWNFVFVGDV